MASNTVNVTGIDEVLKALEAVKSAVAKKIIRAAVLKASKPVLDDMKSLVRVRDTSPANITPRKLLRKSLGRKSKTFRNSGTTVAIVGPRTGRKEQIGVRVKGPNKGQPIFEDPSKIAHLVEFGTSRSQAFPFARPAYDRNKRTSADIMSDEILRQIDLVAAKGG